MSLRSEIIRVFNELIANSKKISELPAAGALTGNELVEVVQGGANVKMTTQDIADLGGGGGGAVDSVNGQTGVVVLTASDVGADATGAAAAAQSAAQAYADGKVIDSIADSDTTHAPSRNSVFDALALKAPLDSPTFTGTPAAPTPSANDNSTKIATTAYVDTADALKMDKNITANRQTASYTLVLGDSTKLVELNNASANTLTVPPNSSVAFPTGTQILFAQYGAGQTTVTPGSGVTLRSAGGALKTRVQYSQGTLIKIATDEWYVAGDLSV